jgi:hypothetical protein
MYLGFTPHIDFHHDNDDTASSSAGTTQCLIQIERGANWLTDFVMLDPLAHKGLHYCQLYCGVLRGALEMVRDCLFLLCSSWCVL